MIRINLIEEWVVKKSRIKRVWERLEWSRRRRRMRIKSALIWRKVKRLKKMVRWMRVSGWWLLRILVWSPLRGVLHHTRSGIGTFGHHLWRLIWKKRSRKKRGGAKVRWLREHGWITIKVIILVVSFVVLAWWLEQTTAEVTEWLKSIPLHYWWWGLGIVGSVILLVWLFRRYGRGARYAGRVVRGIRPGWLIVVLLLVGYGVLVYYKYPWYQLEEMSENEIKEIKKSTCLWEIPDYISDEMLEIDIRLGCPAIIKMEKDQMIVWWGDKSKFVSGWYYKERTTPTGVIRDKFRVFQPKKGVKAVTIKIHRYSDPDPLWYTRQ